MENILVILADTPWWVFPLFAYGVVTGVQAFWPRRVAVWSLILLPLLFLGLSLSSLLPVLGASAWVGALWFGALVAGLAVGWWFLGAEPVSVEPERHAFVAPGNSVILLFFLVVFSVRYVFGYLSAANPSAAGQPALLALVFATSGLVTGTMAGRSAKLYTRYRWHSRTNRSASSAFPST